MFHWGLGLGASVRGGARRVAALAMAALLAACGGGGGATGGGGGSGGTPPPAPVPVGKADAFRFLNQSTFGATEAEAERLVALGDASSAYSRWIDAELPKPASSLLPTVEAAYPFPPPEGFVVGSLQGVRVEQWFQHALHAPDQLRQRVAWALSQVFVVSQVGALQNLPFATADFYDMLSRNAFGDFRVLLREVTLHPAMGVYLSMLGNRKALPDTNLRPDENYAREMMQLFSIGLVELNADGTPRLDGAGQPVPTYDQDTIEGFARVFTGWNWACPSVQPACRFETTRPQFAPVSGHNQARPMQLFPEQHETGAKQLLRYPGAVLPDGVLPAGQAGERDLEDALDNVFNHPNVGPFISRQLIQKLVTSNPSPAYVARVSAKFSDDGAGRRGNLAAVVRAVLLDPEARAAPASDTAGKLKEPLLRLTQLWRAYGARSASGRIDVRRNFPGGPSEIFGQGPGQSPSVFNFYSPFYAPPGEVSDRGLVAPELQLATEYLNTNVTNFMIVQAALRTSLRQDLNPDDVYIQVGEEQALVADADALVDRVAAKLLGDPRALAGATRAEIVAQVNRSDPATAAATRIADAIYLVTSSPAFAVQR